MIGSFCVWFLVLIPTASVLPFMYDSPRTYTTFEIWNVYSMIFGLPGIIALPILWLFFEGGKSWIYGLPVIHSVKAELLPFCEIF